MGVGTITIQPDPPSRGTTITVTLSGGGTPGALTVNFTDGTASYDMPCIISAEGTGQVLFTIPDTWNGTLTVSAPGFNDCNTIVG